MASSPLAERLLARGISPTETSPSEVLQQILSVLQHHWPSSDRHILRPGNTTRNARDIIDDEIQNTTLILNTLSHSTISTLRSQRNATSAVHLLVHATDHHPPPLLLAIFALVTNNGRDFLTLLRISHTCSYWRKVCLEASSLYQQIDISSMPLPVAKLFAMRATEPFTLTLSQGTVPETKDPAPLNAEKCTFCNTNIPNVRAAHFSLGSIPDWVQSAPANQLERFTMDLVPSPSSTSHPPIIEKLFDDKTPKLRELFLSGFRLGWHAKAYHNLKKLSISLEQIPDSTSRTLIGEGRDIVLILQNSPHLEELSLKHPPIMQDVSLSSTPLDLPHLSRLNLDLVTSDVCFLLSAIISPPHQRLCIRAYELIGAFGLRQGPFSILPPDPRCSQCIGSLSHLEINVHRQMVRGWTTTSNNEKPSVEIMFSSFEDMMMTLLTIRTMDLASNLEVVHLVGSTLNLTGSDVVQALKLSSRITALRLEGCSSSILNLLAIQVLHSRVPVASNLHTFNFCQMKVESKDILSLSNSFATRIRKVKFDACTFESQEIERQLLADLRQSGAVDVLSSNAVIMKRYVHHDPVQSPANPDKPAKQTHRAVSRGGSRSSANAAAPTAESGRSKKGKKKKKK